MATKDITDLQVLRAQREWKQNPQGPYGFEILASETGECVKVCLSAMERAWRRGLIEYGTSLHTGWLTSQGEELLKNES